MTDEAAPNPSGVRGGGRGVVLIWGAWLVGSMALAAGAHWLWTVDGTCPSWEDEGTSAAPASTYARVMCAPEDPPLTWAVLAPVVLMAMTALVAQRRWRRTVDRRGLLVSAVLLAVVPPVLLGGLHLALPRDCSSGRTETGDCSRDREMQGPEGDQPVRPMDLG